MKLISKSTNSYFRFFILFLFLGSSSFAQTKDTLREKPAKKIDIEMDCSKYNKELEAEEDQFNTGETE